MTTATFGPRLPAERTLSPARPLWAIRLEQFAARNANRIVTLTVDDAGLASQARVARYRLRAVSYDPSADQAQIVLASPASAGTHLTHVVRIPDAVELVASAEGHDLAVRIVHGSGRSVLAFDH